MRAGIFRYLQGYVKIEIRGQRIEPCLNLAAAKGFRAWQIHRTAARTAECYVTLKDFFRLRTVLKETGCRVHVLGRFGFPFFLDKLEQRKFFSASMVVFVVGIYLLSSLVWNVQVSGNEKVATADILLAAKEEGIYPFQWKFRMKDIDRLAKALQTRLPGTAWVGVNIQGTQVEIKVVESDVPEKKPLRNPRHLVSTADAVVTDIFVDKGRPVVKLNQRVRQGDILVSGIIGDEEYQEIIVAEGIVRGLVWHEYKITVPLKQKVRSFTGAKKERSYLVVGNRALQLTGYGKLGFEKFETIASRKELQWKNYKFPLGWLHEKIMQVEYEVEPVAQKEAKQLGLKHAREDILEKYGMDAKIMYEKILHEEVEDGKVYMKVLFEVDEMISKELPIVQGE